MDVAHSGLLTGPGIEPPLEEAWSRPLQGFVSYPVVAEGKVFVTVGDPEGPYGTVLHALDAATGQSVWERPIAGTYWASYAAYDDGRVFVGNSDGLVRAFRAADGTPLWESSFDGAYGFAGTPIAHEGRVYYSAAGDGISTAALSQTDGGVLWQASLREERGTPALAAGRVFVASPCVYLSAAAASDGAVLWEKSTGCLGGGATVTAADDELVYVAQTWPPDDEGAVFRASDGAVLRTFAASAAPALAGDRAIFRHGSTLWAETRSDATRVWTFEAPGSLASPPLVSGRTVYVGGGDGTIYAVDLLSGELRWTGRAAERIHAPDPSNARMPIPGLGAGDGLLLVPAVGRLVAYRGAPAGSTGGGDTTEPPATEAGPGQQAEPTGPPGASLSVQLRRRQTWSAVRRGIRVRVRVMPAPAVVEASLYSAGRRTRLARVARRLTRAGWTTMRMSAVRRGAKRAPPRRVTVVVRASWPGVPGVKTTRRIVAVR